ncbi:alpha/beta-hydrolase [Penicillium subrubescens]|uniref:alpha/beta-hydrolase n=1 Tax=Penicillium subrubescens TaxID=1316194 RepID=UPI0025458B23|nr:alpha/beta-hydrolase [Penicillium subrubescens]KAJ5880406.1 alpha/beta-hydrolase [Penicillium subrubescens]
MSTQLKRISLPNSRVSMFYRELSGSTPKKTILLLHGFPSSSHQYRKLIPLLATTHRVVAPDLPGFGFTEVPEGFKYSFETLTDTLEEFVDAMSLSKFSIYIFDYGAPVGLRLALRRADAIEAIISQNGNAYTEGFGDVWGPIQEFWASENSAEDRAKMADAMLTYDMTKFQYLNGTIDASSIAPESYTLDYALMERPGNKDVQLDLFMDYQSNVAIYEKFQEYFRSSQIPLLAVWGKNDVKFLDAGHLASESHAEEVAEEVISFLEQLSG